MVTHLILKILILLLYLLVVVILCRVLDTIAWCETGFLATNLVDPLSLSVKKLKSLLDTRGLEYDGVVEKEELVKLVQSSGDVVDGEVSLLENTAEVEGEQKATEFSSGSHFYEEVEDKKDSVWLIQVVSGGEAPVLSNHVWKSVSKKVKKFGIRPGVFMCARDMSFCGGRLWRKSRVILVMPEGQRQKDRLTTVEFHNPRTSAATLHWINTNLLAKIKTIQTEKALCNEWLSSGATNHPTVRVVLMYPRKDISLSYSVMSLKYSGRVKFGIYDSNLDNIKCPGIKLKTKPQSIIVTPESVWVYGSRPGEYYNARALDSLLCTLAAEVNDLFILSFCVVNLFCFMDFFIVSGGVAKVVAVFVWHLFKHNLFILLLWLPALWLFQISFLANFSWWLLRSLSQSWIASILRQDWLHYSPYKLWLLALFSVVCYICGRIHKKFRPVTREDSLSSLEWIKLIWHHLYLFMIRPSNNYIHHQVRPNQLEEGIELLLFNHFSTPDLWLHPVISGEYIPNLAQWRYGGLQKQKEDGGCFQRLCSSCKRNFIRFNCFQEKDKDHWSQNSGNSPKGVCGEEGAIMEQPKGINDSIQKSVENLGFNEAGTGSTVDKFTCSRGTSPVKDLKDLTFCEKCLENNGGIECFTKSKMDSKTPSSITGSPIDSPQGQRNSTIDRQGKPKGTDCFQPLGKDASHFDYSLQWKNSISNEEKIYDLWPEDMIECAECAICLEPYQLGVLLCGLPCGHAYHHQCVTVWLTSGKHCCPSCRWPAFKRKTPKLLKHME